MSRQPSSLLALALPLLLVAPAFAQGTDPDLVPPPLPREPSRSITLAQALAIADREAADVVARRIQIERSEAAERIAWAGILPVITGTLTYQRFDEPIVRAGVGTVRDENQFNGSIAISETLSLRTLSAVRIAEETSDLERVSLEDAERLAHGTIARLFFTVLAARRSAELTRVQITDAVRQLEAARARAELGAGIALDVARAEVAALDAARRIADADSALRGAWDQLGLALGLGEPVGARPSELPALPADEARAIARATSARADVRGARAVRALASLAIDDAWYRLAPTLTLSWTGTLLAPTTLFNPDPAQWIGAVTLSIPFYDGGARYGFLRDAELRRAQADEALEAVERTVWAEVRDAMRRVEIAERTARIAARQADVARRAADAAEESYRLGNLTGLELDAARQARERADLERILADLELATARVDVLTATGEL
jgi:outer membrane protein